jgi:hypothetical protein
MLEIDSLSKESVYNIMLKHLIVMNSGWFKFENLIRTKYPEVIRSKEYMQVLEEYCAGQALALSKALDIKGNGIDDLIALLRCSHWAIFEWLELEKLTEESCRMRIIGCSTQVAAKKWGMEHYDCAAATLTCLKGFCNQISPDVIVKKIFAPPEVRPKYAVENVSCEWLISLARVQD